MGGEPAGTEAAFSHVSSQTPADGRTFATYAGVLDQQRRRLPPGSSLFVGNGDDLSDQLEVPAVFGVDRGYGLTPTGVGKVQAGG